MRLLNSIFIKLNEYIGKTKCNNDQFVVNWNKNDLPLFVNIVAISDFGNTWNHLFYCVNFTPPTNVAVYHSNHINILLFIYLISIKVWVMCKQVFHELSIRKKIQTRTFTPISSTFRMTFLNAFLWWIGNWLCFDLVPILKEYDEIKVKQSIKIIH